MSNFIDEVVQEESITIAKQPIRVKTRKLKSSFSLEAQQDISAMYGGEKDDFHG